MDLESQRLVLSLVRAYLLVAKENLSYVPGYTVTRWKKRVRSGLPTLWRSKVVSVDGHWRRKALCTESLRSMSCATRLQELVFKEDHTGHTPPPPSFLKEIV